MPAKSSRPANSGQVTVVVPVVAAAHEQEPGRELDGLDGARPSSVPPSCASAHRRPTQSAAIDAVVEVDVRVDASLGGGVLDVAEDGVAVGNRLLSGPRAGRNSRACACPSRSGCRGSGRDPRCRRSRRGPRRSRSWPRSSGSGGNGRHRCRTGRPRRRARRGGRRCSRSAPGPRSGPTARFGHRCQTPVPIELSLTEPSTSEDPVLSGFHQLRGLRGARLGGPARGASRRARCFITLTLTLNFGE